MTEGGPPEIKAQDFDSRIDVLPVSDPNIFSMSQRISLAQTQLQLVQSNPQIHGGPQGLYQAYRKMYEALGVGNIESILPPPPQPMPLNAAKENQNALLGQPLQAFPQQDHQAHIQAHLAMMTTPAVQSNANVVAMLQGHIQEHIGILAEQTAQQQVMASIPPENQAAMQDPNIQMQLQGQIEMTAAKLVAEMVEQYAQTITPQNQEDPLVSIRKQELALKGADLQRKQQEFDEKQDMERTRQQQDSQLEKERINVSKEALDDKTRIAEERIQTQRDIAALKSTGR